MAGKRIMQTDIRKLIKLHEEGKSLRWISRELSIHRKTITGYISFIKSKGLTSTDVSKMTDKDLNILFDADSSIENKKHDEFIKFINAHQKDRYAKGFTIYNLYKIYQEECEDGYGRSQFYEQYKELTTSEKGSVRLHHKYGDKLFVDYAGKRLEIIDKTTGEIKEVKVFVGLLAASNYTYVEAVLDEKKASFINSCANCMEYFDGVPECIVPDNLKSAVSKASKYEPLVNRSFKDFADHYDTVINPTRSYSPKDKALVEGMVRIVYQEIYFAIRNITFFSLAELNRQIRHLLKKLNGKLLSKRELSRTDLYLEERKYLKPLPIQKFEMWEYKKAKVQKMGYVLLSPKKNYYSIPYRYIGKQVELRYNTSVLEVYYKSERIATHKISNNKGHYVTIKEHLCSSNQHYLEWSPEFFIRKASHHGIYIKEYAEALILQSKYPEIAYKQCLGILSLSKKYGSDRLNDACQMALNHTKKSYTMIKNILENETDILWKDSITDEPSIIPIHQNIRGKNNYQ